MRDRLSQVVFNLAMNAIDATAKNGEIHLEAELDGSNLALRVRDDGRGVADADLDKLFQPYYTTKPQGTGLGLFVSRQIIEEMGGTLTYRSQADQGAEFVIVLPKERLETAAARNPPRVFREAQFFFTKRTDEHQSTVSRAMLIVDDEDVIARTLQEFLQSEGYDVVTAIDGTSALAWAEKFEPDLAICDIQLPGMDGLELLDRLLQVQPETLVMMITAYATVETAVAAFQRARLFDEADPFR